MPIYIRLQRLGVWNAANTALFPNTTAILKDLNIPLAVRGVMFAKQLANSGTTPGAVDYVQYQSSNRGKASFRREEFHLNMPSWIGCPKRLLDCCWRGKTRVANE